MVRHHLHHFGASQIGGKRTSSITSSYFLANNNTFAQQQQQQQLQNNNLLSASFSSTVPQWWYFHGSAAGWLNYPPSSSTNMKLNSNNNFIPPQIDGMMEQSIPQHVLEYRRRDARRRFWKTIVVDILIVPISMFLLLKQVGDWFFAPESFPNMDEGTKFVIYLTFCVTMWLLVSRFYAKIF